MKPQQLHYCCSLPGNFECPYPITFYPILFNEYIVDKIIIELELDSVRDMYRRQLLGTTAAEIKRTDSTGYPLGSVERFVAHEPTKSTPTRR